MPHPFFQANVNAAGTVVCWPGRRPAGGNGTRQYLMELGRVAGKQRRSVTVTVGQFLVSTAFDVTSDSRMASTRRRRDQDGVGGR